MRRAGVDGVGNESRGRGGSGGPRWRGRTSRIMSLEGGIATLGRKRDLGDPVRGRSLGGKKGDLPPQIKREEEA